MNKSNSAAQMGINGKEARQENDLYCTNPKALEYLLKEETFNHNIWECCNGLSHLSNLLISEGYNVKKSDIIKYQEDIEIIDFLENKDKWEGDIITNPPYTKATEFIIKALDTVQEGNKIAMYLKINFLASQKRRALFQNNPPRTIYVMCTRFDCVKDGDFEKYKNGAVDYCWIVWEKGYKGETKIKWIS